MAAHDAAMAAEQAAREEAAVAEAQAIAEEIERNQTAIAEADAARAAEEAAERQAQAEAHAAWEAAHQAAMSEHEARMAGQIPAETRTKSNSFFSKRDQRRILKSRNTRFSDRENRTAAQFTIDENKIIAKDMFVCKSC